MATSDPHAALLQVIAIFLRVLDLRPRRAWAPACRRRQRSGAGAERRRAKRAPTAALHGPRSPDGGQRPVTTEGRARPRRYALRADQLLVFFTAHHGRPH